jgi:hypothetical protein
MKIINDVPPPLFWDVCQMIMDLFILIVNGCVFKKSCGNWLISNDLHVAITLALTLKEDFGITPSMANIMENDIIMVLELLMLLSTLRNKYVAF